MAHNPFRQELDSRNPFAAELKRRETPAAESFFDAAGRRLVNNALALPSGVGTAIAFGSAGLSTGARKLLGQDVTFEEQFELNKSQGPAALLRKIPAPTIEGISAGIRSLPALAPGGDNIVDRFREEKAGVESRFAESAAAHPVAAAAGDVAGDVASIVTGRAPVARAINKAETKLAGKAPDLFFGGMKPLDPGAKRVASRVINSQAVRTLARGTGRSLEAGFEAAALDVMHGDDPLETAAFAAGTQAGGSILLHAGKGLVSGGPLKAGAKLGLAAFSAGSIVQMLKSATPGGQNFILESLETGYDKVTFGLLLGAVAGLAGSGRLRGGQLAEDLPKFTDALAAIPRAATISLIEGFVNASPESQQEIETVLTKLSEDPEFFGEAETNRLSAAMENGVFFDELNALKQEQGFQQKLFSLMPPALQAGGF